MAETSKSWIKCKIRCLSINTYRNNLRDEEIDDVENSRKNWQTSVYYMDIVSELEKMGDFMINVSQALYKLQR